MSANVTYARPRSRSLASNEPAHPSVLTASAVLERGSYSWIWVVRACPYCGKSHEHYGGALDGDPHKLLRYSLSAHCDKPHWPHHTPGGSNGELRYVLEVNASN